MTKTHIVGKFMYQIGILLNIFIYTWN
jgi:hypothetical protein